MSSVNPSLSSAQWALLQPVLTRAIATGGFQSARLGLRSEEAGDVVKTPDLFLQNMSRTTKGELEADRDVHPPYGSNHTEALGCYTRFCQTSGTTARPLAVWDTEESWSWLLDNWMRGYALAGVQPGMVAFFAFSFGPFLGFWTAFEAGLRLGLRCIPGGGLGTVARLNVIVEHGVEVLCCTPTYALHLAGVAREQGLDLSRGRVRKILVAGEPGGSLHAVRKQLEEAWPGAEVIDHYGMTEVGPVAFAASGEPGSLRVLEDRYFAEVLDAGGAPVPEGEVGQLVLTPLGRSSWPLFRYCSGDLVRARRGADGLRLAGGILGRADDMLIVRGVNVYPGAVEDVVRMFAEIVEYRVSVFSKGGLTEVAVEVEAPGAKGAAPALEAAFERAFALRIPVREVAAGSLPRFELKARRWVRL